MRRASRTALLAALLGGAVWAQYGYDPTHMWPPLPGYAAPGMAGYPDLSGMDPMAAMDLIGQQLAAAMQQQQAQLDHYQQQMAAQEAQLVRYFIELYRTTTGDTTSPDQVAYQYGQVIHCQRYPVDCQIAAQNARSSSQALAAQQAAWQARMQQQQATFDAANQAWWDQQAANDRAHQGFIDGVIYEVGPYTSAGGQTQMLPFAPSQGTYYQSPAGNPLFFDPTFDVWYEVAPDGTLTPFYGTP